MKVLIVYESVFGCTEKIAQAIGGAFQPPDEVTVTRPPGINPAEVAAFDLVIVGAPTQGGRPTRPIQDFLAGMPEKALNDTKVAAFDTRLQEKDHKGFVKFIIKTFGYAAGKIADILKSKGGTLAAGPEGFIVTDREGPLKDGEIERAAEWGKKLTHTTASKTTI